MKKHAIIPVFIPHRGCPNDCVFCNQKAITARGSDVTPEDVRLTIEQYLPTLTGRGLETIELAFFGGSFTGIPLCEQSAFLEVAAQYKSRGLIDKIHMSTRPDYITPEILDNLKKYDADTIELGVQSFDDEVLAKSGRGHTAEAVYQACELIKSRGFELGIQLMIGLPGDTPEKCIFSAMETVRIGPSIARLYPTIVLENTALYEMHKAGTYHPLTTEEAVSITKEMYRILDEAGINIIRVGLKSTDLISGSGTGRDHTAGHTYHPAFRQLVEGELAKEALELRLEKLLTGRYSGSDTLPGTALAGAALPGTTVVFSSSRESFSNMVGNGGCNRKYFESKYPDLKFRFSVDDRLPRNTYTAGLSCKSSKPRV
ncbi:MAG: elongator complex protein 3 [Lentihominibacter sp.]